MKISTRAAIAFGALFLLASCSIKQELLLDTDGSGTSTLEVDLKPLFMKYYEDLAAGFSQSYDPKNPRVFDTDAIRRSFEANPGMELVSVATPEPHRLRLAFRFKDVSTMVRSQDQRVRDMISVKRKDGSETIRIYLDAKNLPGLLRIAPNGESRVAKMLLPPEGKALTEEEYLDHLAWALEDYAGDEDVKAILKRASVDLGVKVKGRIVDQTGGRLHGDSEVRFSIPLLGLFTLKTPLEYSLTYRKN